MSLLPTVGEHSLVLSFIDEALRLFGLPARLYSPDSVSMYEDNVQVSSFVDIAVLLGDYVDRKLLADLRWNHMEAGQDSLECFLPVRYGDRDISVVEDMVLEFRDSRFRVVEVNRSYLVGLWYIARLVPYVTEPDREVDGFKSSYMSGRRREIR